MLVLFLSPPDIPLMNPPPILVCRHLCIIYNIMLRNDTETDYQPLPTIRVIGMQWLLIIEFLMTKRSWQTLLPPNITISLA